MTGFTRKLQARYTLYLGSPIQRFLISGVLLTALWVDSVVFGVLLVLFVSGLQASLLWRGRARGGTRVVHLRAPRARLRRGVRP